MDFEDTEAINFHGRTVVPVRFVSEELGAEVEWDDRTWTVSISTGQEDHSLINDASTDLDDEMEERFWKILHLSFLNQHVNYVRHLSNEIHRLDHRLLAYRYFLVTRLGMTFHKARTG